MLSGDLSTMSLADVLQWADGSRARGVLTIERPSGAIWMQIADRHVITCVRAPSRGVLPARLAARRLRVRPEDEAIVTVEQLVVEHLDRERLIIQAQVAAAWVLYAEGKHDDALKAMSAAADAEDKTEKHPVTPGVPKPARELYGVMLLERGMAKEALAAFEATLKKEPNRLGAYVGAAKAAEKAGDKAKAREYSKKVVAVAGGADKTRTEVTEARAFLKTR